jgi:C4-dicarboxylate transporter DctM subunit
MALALATIVTIYAHQEMWPKNDKVVSFREFWVSFIKAIPALFLPVIILGGIYSGILTPTESASVAVIYAFIVAVFVYRELDVNKIFRIILNSGKSSAMMLFIIATSTAFSWLFTYSGISKVLVSSIAQMNLSAILFNFIVGIIMLFFGTFLEGIAICVLLVPVLWPIAQSLGVDPIHFGMIVAVSNIIGTMTPPVAVNLFSAASFSKLKMGEIAKGEFPFLITATTVYFVVVFVPKFSTVLLGR